MARLDNNCRKSRPRLWKEITVVLAIKVVVLYLIWATWFSGSHPPADSVAIIGSRLSSPGTQQDFQGGKEIEP
jgi:hypothetical protein